MVELNLWFRLLGKASFRIAKGRFLYAFFVERRDPVNCLKCENNEFRRCGVPFCILPRCVYEKTSQRPEAKGAAQRPDPDKRFGKPTESG